MTMNKLHVFLALIFVLAGIMETAAREQVEPQTLAIGAKAPGFRKLLMINTTPLNLS
jgi:hypothetical protein